MLCVCATPDAIVAPVILALAEWLWLGIWEALSCTVSSPPVSFNVVCVPPYPSINLPDRFGVPFWPLHKAHPDGMLLVVPDHAHMIPDGIPLEPENAISFPSTKALVFPVMNFRTQQTKYPSHIIREGYFYQVSLKLMVSTRVTSGSPFFLGRIASMRAL